MFSRTSTRIALSYALLVLITAGVLALLLGGEFERNEEDALRARLTDQTRALAYAAGPIFERGGPLTEANPLAHDLAATFGTRATLIKPDGVVVGDSEQDPAVMENHATRPEVADVLAHPDHVGSSSRLSATVHRNLLYVAVAVTDPADPSRAIGVARVAYPLTSVEEARNSLWQSLLLTVLLVSIPAALLGVLLARSIGKPLTVLGDVAQRFGRGDLSARSQTTQGGEIGVLSREFNAMADRLSTTIRHRTAERNEMVAVFAHMHDGIITTDGEGRVQSTNPAAALLFDATQDQPVGHSLIELTHSHELHNALRSALADPDQRQRLEIRTGKYDLAAVVTAVPSYDGGSVTGLVVLQDITELHRLERVRRDFIANISHELRTPLASMKLLAETLHSAIHDDPDAAEEFLSRINVELDDLTQLVRELLELSRVESGQAQLDRKPVEVGQLLERTVSRLRAQAERAGLTITVYCNDGLPLVFADSERIEQVLVNLLHNAIKFTDPGGQVTLKAESCDTGVLISAADNGIGIPPEEVPRIFERFYKVDKSRTVMGQGQGEGGSGLGLAIAKHVVQAHGGQIWAESELGKGTTIYFTLPLSG